MKSISFIPLVVLLALETQASRGIEEIKGEPVKMGVCPSPKSDSCFRHEKSLCSSDWQCPGSKRCCRDHCTFKCIDPLPILSTVRIKIGTCPKITGRCLKTDPSNTCKWDGQCEGNFKCCLGMCGKLCAPPQ